MATPMREPTCARLAAVASDQEAPGRTQRVQIDRPGAALFGITPATIDSTLYDAFGQRHIARIYAALNECYVILEVNPRYQLGPNALQRIYVLSQNNTMVPLSQIASLTPAVTPIVVNHQGQFPSVTLSFNLAPGATIGAAVAAVQKATADLRMPASIATSFQGNAQAFQSSLSTTPPLIFAALFAVYIILGMLYESTIHPLTILSTLPSAGLGALVTLMLVARPLDVIGIIGIILLIGIVKKNGIMLVDVALEEQRDRGLSSEEAIHKACLLRFRPILMTCARCSAAFRSWSEPEPGPKSGSRWAMRSSADCWCRKCSRSSPRHVFIYMDTISQALSRRGRATTAPFVDVRQEG
jgi:multidrug efflux pump subunit AcrB